MYLLPLCTYDLISATLFKFYLQYIFLIFSLPEREFKIQVLKYNVIKYKKYKIMKKESVSK